MDARRFKRSMIAFVHGDDFAAEIADLLAAIDAVADDGRARLSALMRLRHAVALHEARARVALTHALIQQLQVVSTVHVARYLMRAACGQGVRNDWLVDAFALRGRRAVVKYMQDAVDALAAQPDLAPRYRAWYDWYRRLVARRVRELRRSWRQARRPARGVIRASSEGDISR